MIKQQFSRKIQQSWIYMYLTIHSQNIQREKGQNYNNSKFQLLQEIFHVSQKLLTWADKKLLRKLQAVKLSLTQWYVGKKEWEGQKTSNCKYPCLRAYVTYMFVSCSIKKIKNRDWKVNKTNKQTKHTYSTTFWGEVIQVLILFPNYAMSFSQFHWDIIAI